MLVATNIKLCRLPLEPPFHSYEEERPNIAQHLLPPAYHALHYKIIVYD